MLFVLTLFFFIPNQINKITFRCVWIRVVINTSRTVEPWFFIVYFLSPLTIFLLISLIYWLLMEVINVFWKVELMISKTLLKAEKCSPYIKTKPFMGVWSSCDCSIMKLSDQRDLAVVRVGSTFWLPGVLSRCWQSLSRKTKQRNKTIFFSPGQRSDH